MRTTEIDCLTNGAPHAAEARRFHAFFESLPEGGLYDFVRCHSAHDLYGRMRGMREADFTISEFAHGLQEVTDAARPMIADPPAGWDRVEPEQVPGVEDEDVGARTGAIYSRLFRDFEPDDYYEKSFAILAERFAVNDVTIEAIETKVALDDGCGAGRFSLALRRLGFREVHGVDLSEQNVDTAIRRRDSAGVEGVHYRVADVLDLPFQDAGFDFVFCNGVLHHTARPIVDGLREIYRVLRPGGQAFVAVMEKPGGILFDTIELLRAVMADVAPGYAVSVFRSLGLGGFGLYSLMDHLLVPVNVRTTPAALEATLEAVGFTDCRRMLRGLASDQIERLHRVGQADPDAVWKYGVGENKYLCLKP